jgi:chromosome segregation ATPase
LLIIVVLLRILTASLSFSNQAEVERLEKALAESNEELAKKDESVSELSSLLEDTRARLLAREDQIRELESRVAALEAARSISQNQNPGEQPSEDEDAMAEHIVEETIADCEAGELRFEARQASRRLSEMQSERDQLQEDVLMIANDASAMLVERVERIEELNDVRDELDEARRELEQVRATLRAVQEENGRLSDVSFQNRSL